MGTVSIRQALQYVADHPEPSTDITLDIKTHELVARALFDIANNPDAKVRGSMARATKAQKLIFDRLVGTRKPGTHPAARETAGLDFVDLTQGVLR